MLYESPDLSGVWYWGGRQFDAKRRGMYLSRRQAYAEKFASQHSGQVFEVTIRSNAKLAPEPIWWQTYKETWRPDQAFQGFDAVRIIEPNGEDESLVVLNPAIVIRHRPLVESLTEGRIKVGINPDAPADRHEMARKIFAVWVRENAWRDMPRLAERYDIRFSEFRDGYSEDTYSYELHPKRGFGGRLRSKERYPGGRLETDTYYRTPTTSLPQETAWDAYKVIPVEPDLAYRGMSFREWEATRSKGEVKSAGSYNLGDQEKEGLTFFAPDAETAAHYSAGFAPMMHKPARHLPGVVIAVPRSLLLSHADRPHTIPSSELATPDPIPISKVRRVWMVVPTEARKGYIELRHMTGYKTPPGTVGKVREGSSMAPTPGGWRTIEITKRGPHAAQIATEDRMTVHEAVKPSGPERDRHIQRLSAKIAAHPKFAKMDPKKRHETARRMIDAAYVAKKDPAALTYRMGLRRIGKLGENMTIQDAASAIIEGQTPREVIAAMIAERLDIITAGKHGLVSSFTNRVLPKKKPDEKPIVKLTDFMQGLPKRKAVRR